MWKYVLIITVLFSLLGCDYFTSEIEDDKHARLEVFYEDNVIYDEELNDEDDSLSVIIDLPDQSQISLDKFVNIIYSPDLEESYRSYIAWARKSDYYTQYAHGYYLDTLQINAGEGFTPVVPDEVCGTMYFTTHYPVRNRNFYIFQDSVIVDSFTTSVNGYFNTDIPFGDYQISKNLLESCENVDFDVDSYYDDYAIILPLPILPKPIIYLYPDEEIEISVELNFPYWGHVTASIPEYGTGWKNLKIEPTGKINKKYDYLFYESQNPELFQRNQGWIISQGQMEAFFIKNLAETGFEGQEIIDFIEYWIPRFTGYPYYTIYPQYKEQLDKMVELEFSVEPENLLRLFYVVEGREDNSIIIKEPHIPEFKREGFFVVEWGARIKPKSVLSNNR